MGIALNAIIFGAIFGAGYYTGHRSFKSLPQTAQPGYSQQLTQAGTEYNNRPLPEEIQQNTNGDGKLHDGKLLYLVREMTTEECSKKLARELWEKGKGGVDKILK